MFLHNFSVIKKKLKLYPPIPLKNKCSFYTFNNNCVNFATYTDFKYIHLKNGSRFLITFLLFSYIKEQHAFKKFSMNKLLSFLVISLLHIPASGQNYPIRHLDISSGLSNNSVASIYQDQNGYMWFGTFDGLNRYDGNDFKVYRHIHTDPNSIQGNAISCIEGDFENNLWIGTTAGPVVFNAERSAFSPLQYYDTNRKVKPF